MPPTNTIPAAVHSGSRAYAFLLYFYPLPLRRQFGAQMISIFEDQLSDAWRLSGLAGALRIWLRAFAELLTVALPARLDPLKIPALSILLSLLFAVLFFAQVNQTCGPHK